MLLAFSGGHSIDAGYDHRAVDAATFDEELSVDQEPADYVTANYFYIPENRCN